MTRTLRLLFTAWLLGCAPDPACDPGQREELGSCLPVAKPAKDAGASGDDAGSGKPDAGPADDCKPRAGHYEGFGKACTTDADCTSCLAPLCATSPINMCSRVQCKGDPEACPPGWTCTDISAFSGDPAVTHICLK